MRIHETVSGHRIEYEDPEPKLERFLKKVAALAEDPEGTEDALVALVYGRENPLLEGGLFPGKGTVTREVLENPLYRVLADHLVRKRLALDGVDPKKLAGKFTLTVSDAAARKGVTPSAIRQAIHAGRLVSWVKNREYFLEPRALDSVDLGTPGRKPKREAG